MEEMKAFVCSPEAGKAAKEAGLFGESVWVWDMIDGRLLPRHPVMIQIADIYPAVMLEEALDSFQSMPDVTFCHSGITAGGDWYGYPTSSDEAVRLAVRIKEGQNG